MQARHYFLRHRAAPLLVLLSCAALIAQDRPPADVPPPAPGKPDRAALEKRFEEMLTGVVFVGTWQMTGEEGLKGKAPLTEPKSERYVIQRVEKALEDNWIIDARIQFADKDVTIPVMVRVAWAGDTPIITLDEMKLPLLGTYSARVMIYRGFYAGTWFGPSYGGVLSGQIVKIEDEAAVTSRPSGAPQRVPAGGE